MNPPPEHVLLVEGPDDKHVVKHVCHRHQYKVPEIYDCNGYPKILDTITAHIKARDRQAVGIILDANQNLQGRWQSISNVLNEAEIKTPKNPSLKGTIIDTRRKPRVGIWLMPDNDSEGELEHFVRQMIPENDLVWPLSEKYIDEIPEPARKFSENKVQKAKIHAWLAAREDPGIFMGTAIRARDLNIKGELATKFFTWLSELFGPNSK